MGPKGSFSVSTLISVLKRVKEELTRDLDFDDPLAIFINTIRIQDMQEAGIFKGKFKKEDIPNIMIAYIDVQIDKYKSRHKGRIQEEFFDELTRTAGGTGNENTSGEESAPLEDHEMAPQPTGYVPVAGTSKRRPSTSPNTLRLSIDDECYEDEENQDPPDTQFNKAFPNLPKGRCPHSLFVSTLRPKYVNSLYDTDRDAYPAKWESMKRNDSDQAWHSLNQTIINFLNQKWQKQGFHVQPGETIVDLYNFNDLKAAIIKTIGENVKGTQTQGNASTNTVAQKDNKYDELMDRLERYNQTLEEAMRTLLSQTVKLTGREINAPTQTVTPAPKLAGYSGHKNQPISYASSMADSDEEIL